MAAERNVLLDNVSANNDIETQANPIPLNSYSSDARLLSERRHLLNVFPEEVWDLVFKKVDDPKSLECLSNSSLFLRDLLAPQRVQFLFPTVLGIMGKNDPIDKNGISWLIKLDNCPLKLRSVCRYWNRAIDNMIDNHPFHFYPQHDDRMRHTIWLWLTFRASVALYNTFSEGTNRHVLSYFDGTHGNANRNPFLGRSIHILFDNDHEEEEIMANFIPAVRSILQKYGIHIFYFGVSARNAPLSDGRLYFLIRKFLQLMPNLKKLTCRIHTADPNSSENELLELSAQINLNPLPALPNLQMLATDCLPPPIFQELIRSNNNIAILDISKNHMDQGYAMSTVQLPLLTTLSLYAPCEDAFRCLNRSRLNWPLTKLFLKTFASERFTSWKPVFNLVNNFSATLTHLQLELPGINRVQDKVYQVQLTLNVPNLSNLSLSMRYITCLDFLLSAKDSLRVFEINIDLYNTAKIRALELMQEAESGRAKIIKLLSCRRGGLESNMWTLFPNLTQIKFKLDCQPPFDLIKYRRKSGPEGEQWSCSRQDWINRANQSTL